MSSQKNTGFNDIFTSIQPPAFKVDVFRYSILYHKGVVYLDSKIVPIYPFDLILPKNGSFIPHDIEKGLQITVMAFPAKDPLLLHSMYLIRKNINKKYYGKNPLQPTGPQLIGLAHSHLVEIGFQNYETSTRLDPKGLDIVYEKTKALAFVFHNIAYRVHVTDQDACYYSKQWAQHSIYYEQPCPQIQNKGMQQMTRW